jgi:hypothetical protein
MISQGFKNNLEMTGAILMSLAALLSTWCGFQNSRWSGVDSSKLTEVNLKHSIAMEKTLVLNQQYAADGMMTLNFTNAVVEGKQNLIDFYMKGMRPELKKIMAKWLYSRNLIDSNAYPHPMAMPEYLDLYNKQYAEGEKLRREAQASWKIASHAGRVADNYLLLSILFSAILFLGGIESKFDLMKVRIMLLSLSGLLFLFSLYRLILLPFMHG